MIVPPVSSAIAAVVPPIVAAFAALGLDLLAQVLDAVLEVPMLALGEAVTAVAVVQTVDLLGLARQPAGLVVRDQAAIAKLVDPLLELVELTLDILAWSLSH